MMQLFQYTFRGRTMHESGKTTTETITVKGKSALHAQLVAKNAMVTKYPVADGYLWHSASQ